MIEVGEYIRTRKGITKIKKTSKECSLCENGLIVNNETHKHSKNIIDLIEVGDIVNGCEVMNIHKPRDIWEPIEVEINSKCTRCFLEGEIKTILTHELYEQNCFKVVI